MRLEELLETTEDDDDMATLFVKRAVANIDEITDWARSQGFESILEDLHVTICYSKEPLSWKRAGPADETEIVVPGDTKRSVEPLGDAGAVVLRFESDDLSGRWKHFRDAGASWDYEEYQPHMTVSYEAGDLDLEAVENFPGPIVLGPETYKQVDEGWSSDSVKEVKTVEQEEDE